MKAWSWGNFELDWSVAGPLTADYTQLQPDDRTGYPATWPGDAPAGWSAAHRKTGVQKGYPCSSYPCSCNEAFCLSSGLLFHYRRSISGKAHSWVASKVFGAPCVTSPTPDKSSRSSDVTVEIPNAKQQLEAARARARLTSLADGGDGKTSSTSCNPPPMLKRQSSSRGSRIGQMLERMATKSNSYASLEERLSLSVAGLEVNIALSPAGSRSQSKTDLFEGEPKAVTEATAPSGPSP